MRVYKILFVLQLLVLAIHGAGQTKSLLKYVDPFIGTGASGHTFPGATVPCGLVQVSPETGNAAWPYCAGYQHKDSIITGFSQTHLSGTGVADLGDVLLQPFTGDILRKDYGSRFTHKSEVASPGYYSVNLKDFGVSVELTATQHSAYHRYIFGRPDGHVLVDIAHGLVNNADELASHLKESQLRIRDANTLIGYRITNSWGGERHVYFIIRFNHPFKARHWLGDSTRSQRLILDFISSGSLQLTAKVGISTVSIAGAEKNMKADIGTRTFGQVKSESAKRWNAVLSTIWAEGTPKQKRIFYTALYHSFIAPNNIADVDGRYRGADNKIYTATNGVYYSTLSLWDTFRALDPLYTIIRPSETNGIIQSMLAHFDVAGFLPIWSLWGHENYCMIANHAIPVIVDAYKKGIRGYDIAKAYQAIYQTSVVNHKNSSWDIYNKYGYLPNDLVKTESVSTTLESSFDDWCVAEMARMMNKKSDAALFAKRSAFYRNVFDPGTRLMRGRKASGEWASPFDPLKISHAYSWGGDFTEGNAWQYSWHVMQDIPGLVKLMGGRKAFLQHLDSLFSMESKVYGEGSTADVTGLIGQYVQGNEPSHHVAYLYALAGSPANTQRIIRQITTTLYDDTPEGLSGNDDCGQMSAWYIFSAMGFYPLNPASGQYVLGAPQLKQAHIRLPNGKIFRVIARGLSVSNYLVKQVRLNGRLYSKPYITHKDLLDGGTLEFVMMPVNKQSR